jgi:hypothetical protein
MKLYSFTMVKPARGAACISVNFSPESAPWKTMSCPSAAKFSAMERGRPSAVTSVR